MSQREMRAVVSALRTGAGLLAVLAFLVAFAAIWTGGSLSDRLLATALLLILSSAVTATVASVVNG